MVTSIGKSIQRKDAWEKVTGFAQYTDDFPTTGVLCARLLTSPYGHARILKIDTAKASAVKGVKSILTGDDFKELHGPLLLDRPALAQNVVRYAGEPVALVVAQEESVAERAVRLIEVEYEPLPVLLTPSESLSQGAVLIHEKVTGYKRMLTDIYPEEGTNIASRYHIQKGNAAEALKKCEYIVQKQFSLPPSDHLAMEVRTARAEISSDGQVQIMTSSQSPYAVRQQISGAFMIPAGQIQVTVPFIGGGFGGKSAVMLEILAFLASKSVGGKAVRLIITREQDMAAPPSRIGLEADITIGADKDGKIQAAQMIFRLDCGAYTDISPYMAKAIAADCTGPYHMEHVLCDSLCVYTNHTYATAYRSFAHESYTFCMERVIDLLAKRCGWDPLEFRYRNAIHAGSTTPTQVPYTESLIGDLRKCLSRARQLSLWDAGSRTAIKQNTVKAKGIACFWKTENPPTDAISGATVTFNTDGSVNLVTGVVEMGSNGQTHLAQILAEKLGIPCEKVHVMLSVDTRAAPEHWKTVASLTEYMAGKAVLRAADDLLQQLRSNGSQVFGCPISDIEVSHGRVYSIRNPERFIEFKDIAQGYQAPDGTSIGEPVLGRGGMMLKGLSMLDPQTGKGKTGPAWTLGAQVVEVEADITTFSYRILSALTVMDVGKVINPESMRSMVAGGMAMGMSMASREAASYDSQGVPQAPTLRTYKLMHIGQEPDYQVDFVETPQDDSPYGMRSYAEHGLIAIPAALGNALSNAFGIEEVTLPLTPETIWKASQREKP